MAPFIEHVVLMKASRPFSEAETAEVMGLKEIPGVVSVSCGPNYTKRGQGYTLAVVVRLTTKEAEEGYQTHPEHVRVRDSIIAPLVAAAEAPKVLVVDYEHEVPECPIGWKSFMCMGFVMGAGVGVLAAKMRL